MPHSAKPCWTNRTVAASLFLSLALHGLLLLALWVWPARTRSPALAIESTRISLDTCVLDSPSPTLLPDRELPADLLGQNGDTALAPRLEGSPPILSKMPAPSEPRALASGSRKPLANARGSEGSLFPLPATAASVVYVLDRSVSMGIDRKLDFARRELIASLRRLPPSARFQVIDYNDSAKTLVVEGQRNLLPAEPAIVDKAVSLLEALEAAGTTNHFAALCRGLDLRPDVLYFLTDADDLKPEVIAAITRRNQRSIIHTIELTRLRTPHPEGPLAQLARDNRGSYRRVAFGHQKTEE